MIRAWLSRCRRLVVADLKLQGQTSRTQVEPLGLGRDPRQLIDDGMDMRPDG